MIKYNPHIHHRRSIRLKGYDYAQAGLYFITICCQDRICRFGQVENGKMILNEYGKIAQREWLQLSERFPNFELYIFQIMPNHMHGIIALVGATLAVAPNNDAVAPNNDAVAPNNDAVAPSDAVATNDDAAAPNDAAAQKEINIQAGASVAPTVSNIVGAYKSLVSNECLNIYKSKNETMGKLWQRNYYEHIIRNDKSYQNISNYIINNPAKWPDDKFHQS